ncbi:MAG: hypothetical protein JNL80_12565 [Phycisphaerae bacterium]|nr:hypothetical protein [Phycisphaerae bacterium]
MRTTWTYLALLAACLTGGVVAGPTGSEALGEPRSRPALAARELSAPPEDLVNGRLRLPDPTSIESGHALLRLKATREGGVAVAQAAVPHVGTAKNQSLVLMVAMNSTGPWDVQVRSPRGAIVVGQAVAKPDGVDIRDGDLGGLLHAGQAIPIRRIEIAAADAGVWRIDVVGPASESGVDGVLLAGTTGEVEPHMILRGRFEGWVSRVGITREFLLDAGVPLEGVMAVVRSASGTITNAAPIEGGVAFVPSEPGPHTLEVRAGLRVDVARGASGLDGSVLRTLEIPFVVSGSTVRSTGRATSSNLDVQRTRVALPVEGGSEGEEAFVAGEIWSVSASGERPVCWLGSMGTVTNGALAVTFDRRWLAREGVRGGALELRDVRIMGRDASTVIDRVATIPLGQAPAAVPFDPRDEMSLLQGRGGGHPFGMSVEPSVPADDAAFGSHALMLVHGYCSDGQPFPPSHFTGQVATFMDPNQARSNDEFAQLVGAFGGNVKSFGVVAHSQGGLASLHLYTFYWSGLDWATGPRLIQSVGSPYQGTPLAGNLAVLGDIFGVGCGPVNDMSPDGATAWLANIPSWARAKVWYWTTSYKDYPFSYDYCDFVSDLFLSNPDDGVIEKSKGQLPGANNMGHTDGWCHVADMEDPPQCTDATRNAQMNGSAAR